MGRGLEAVGSIIAVAAEGPRPPTRTTHLSSDGEPTGKQLWQLGYF